MDDSGWQASPSAGSVRYRATALAALPAPPDRIAGPVAWARGANGRLLLAVGNVDDGGRGVVRVWEVDPVGGRTNLLGTPLTRHNGAVESVAWARGANGRLLLAAGTGANEERDARGEVRIWEVDPADGRTTPLGTLLTQNEEWVWSLAWTRGGNGRLLLAVGTGGGIQGGDDAGVHVWGVDPADGRTTLLSTPLTRPVDAVFSVAWARGGNGCLLLAAGTRSSRGAGRFTSAR